MDGRVIANPGSYCILFNLSLARRAAVPVDLPKRSRELVEGWPDLIEIMAPLLVARPGLRSEFSSLHRRALAIVSDDAVCRRLMTVRGVGTVTLRALVSKIDGCAGLRRSRSV